jgi:dihydroorotate dehydrogenase
VALLAGEADWFTVNVSSPNTPDLRALQAPDRLARLLGAVVGAAATRPVLFKLAPEIDTLAESVEVAIEAGCAGIIATNTTTSRPGSTGRLGEAGGLSGAPLWPLARQRLGEVLAAVRGRLPVIGVGGISSPAQALELLDQGCAAIQLYTGLIYEGPGLPWRIGQAIEARRAP